MVLLHFTVDPKLLHWRKYLMQAAKRDDGDAHRMLPFTFEMLDGIRRFVVHVH